MTIAHVVNTNFASRATCDNILDSDWSRAIHFKRTARPSSMIRVNVNRRFRGFL